MYSHIPLKAYANVQMCMGRLELKSQVCFETGRIYRWVWCPGVTARRNGQVKTVRCVTQGIVKTNPWVQLSAN